MNRTYFFRLVGLAVAMSWITSSGRAQSAFAQTGVAPAAQPVWINPAPMYQVGANGAVNLDQPTAMPYGAYQLPGEVSCNTPTYPAAIPAPGMMAPGMMAPAPMAAPQPVYTTPNTWVVPAQPVQQAPCPTPMAQQPVVATPPASPFGWTVFGEALYLQPTGVDVVYAQQQDGPVPIGELGVADPGYDLGFRLGGELQFSPDAAIFGSYAWYEESTTSTLSPRADIIGSTVRPLVFHPGAGVADSLGPVDATYDIEFQIAELAYRQFLILDPVRKVSVFAGGRYGHLEQRFMLTGNFGAVIPPRIDLNTDLEFSGGGPMAGIDAERMLGASRFSVYGHGLVAALTGQFESHYRLINRTTTTLLAESNWEEDRIVPMLDYELGLAWTSPQGHFRFSAGYLASHWFNVITTPVYIDAVQADDYTDVDDTISFDGLVGRAEVRW